MLNIQQGKIYASDESESNIVSTVNDIVGSKTGIGAISLWVKSPLATNFSYVGTVEGTISEIQSDFATMLSGVYENDIIVVVTTTTIIE